MGLDIRGLLKQMEDNGQWNLIFNNPLAQFGTPNRRYLGATLFPEKRVTSNKYREEGIRYRTVIANHATRYSPVQLKGSVLVGSADIELAETDMGSQFTGSDYDALLRMLSRVTKAGDSITMEAMLALAGWADQALRRPLVEVNEKMIWDAVVDASVVRTGDNGFTETVSYSNPAGHRFAAGGTWSNNSYDPFDDVASAVNKLAEKGYVVNRILAGQPVISIMQKNAKVRERGGLLSIASGTIVGKPATMSLAALNNAFNNEGLPPIEPYNLVYRTQQGSGYFLKRDVMVFVATTGQDAVIDLDRGDNEPIVLTDTLGYTAIGTPAGNVDPGIREFIQGHEDKPPRIDGQAWQTSLPVITEPESLAVITTIA